MSYSKELSFRDYTICFEYEIDMDEGLVLTEWVAYEGNNEVLIPCVTESNFIERQLQKWLDKEWSNNSCNYITDQRIDEMERRSSFMEDR